MTWIARSNAAQLSLQCLLFFGLATLYFIEIITSAPQVLEKGKDDVLPVLSSVITGSNASAFEIAGVRRAAAGLRLDGANAMFAAGFITLILSTLWMGAWKDHYEKEEKKLQEALKGCTRCRGCANCNSGPPSDQRSRAQGEAEKLAKPRFSNFLVGLGLLILLSCIVCGVIRAVEQGRSTSLDVPWELLREATNTHTKSELVLGLDPAAFYSLESWTCQARQVLRYGDHEALMEGICQRQIISRRVNYATCALALAWVLSGLVTNAALQRASTECAELHTWAVYRWRGLADRGKGLYTGAVRRGWQAVPVGEDEHLGKAEAGAPTTARTGPDNKASEQVQV